MANGAIDGLSKLICFNSHVHFLFYLKFMICVLYSFMRPGRSYKFNFFNVLFSDDSVFDAFEVRVTKFGNSKFHCRVVQTIN